MNLHMIRQLYIYSYAYKDYNKIDQKVSGLRYNTDKYLDRETSTTELIFWVNQLQSTKPQLQKLKNFSRHAFQNFWQRIKLLQPWKQ